MDINKGMEHFRNGEAFYKGGEFGRAVDEFSKAIEFMPESEEAYLWRAHSYRESRDIDKAIPDIRKALEIYPEHVGAKEFLENALKMQAAKNAMFEERVVVRTVRSSPQPRFKTNSEISDELQREAEDRVRQNNADRDYNERADHYNETVVRPHNEFIERYPEIAKDCGYEKLDELEKVEYDPRMHLKDEIAASLSKIRL